MTLYVESNFVIEVALGQEEAGPAGRLLEAAESGHIVLAIPAFSAWEPFGTVTRRIWNRERLRKQFDAQLGQLTRSTPHREEVAALRIMPDVLARIDKREDDLLVSTIER